MYQIRDTEEYREDLEELSGKHPGLQERLWRTVYYDLAINPYKGNYSERAELWSIRQWIITPVLLVQIAYEIDEEAKVVELIGIRAVNTIRL